jgi:hypothetical protein
MLQSAKAQYTNRTSLSLDVTMGVKLPGWVLSESACYSLLSFQNVTLTCHRLADMNVRVLEATFCLDGESRRREVRDIAKQYSSWPDEPSRAKAFGTICQIS